MIRLYKKGRKGAKNISHYKDDRDRKVIIEAWRKIYKEEFENYYIQITPFIDPDRPIISVTNVRSNKVVFRGIAKQVAKFLKCPSEYVSIYKKRGTTFRKQFKLANE